MGTKGIRTEVLQQLQELGVESVTAGYNGFADSGQIEDPDFGSVDVSGVVEKAVLDLFYDVLEELYAGWELDDGSFGHFRWNVREDMINLVHTTMTESTEEQSL